MMESLEALNHFFAPDFVDSLSEESFLYGLMRAQRPTADILRQHTDDCLELALRYKLADADLVARLRKGDWETFTAAMNELRCAKLLERLFGVNSLRWHPQGREGKVGEFEIVSSNLENPIFVEVKTILSRELDELERRVKEKLHRYAKQVRFPFGLSVTIKDVGMAEDFSGVKFKDFLNKELGKIDAGSIQEGCPLPDYRDNKTGLHLEIEAYPTPPDKPIQTCYIGVIGGYELKPVENEDYIRYSLKRAYDQLPRGEQSCLVILCSLTAFPIDEYDMLNALLGTRVDRIYRRSDGTLTEPEPFREPDGFYHPHYRRHLSATVVYREKFAEERIESNLEIYHNPFALNPIDPGIFEGKDVRQLVRTGETDMGWKD